MDDYVITESLGVSVGDLIRMFRNKNNITQSDMAKALNLSVTTIANYEAGKTVPDIYTLKRIYSILDIPTKIKIKQPGDIVLDLYDAGDGLLIDDNGLVLGDVKEIRAEIFNLYSCRKLDFCCIMKGEKIYLLNNTDFLDCGDVGLVRFPEDKVFVPAKYENDQYTDIFTGRVCNNVEYIVAKFLGEVDDYEIIE